MDKEPRVYIKGEDGTLWPAEMSEYLARKAAIYLELQRLGLTPEAIKMIVELPMV